MRPFFLFFFILFSVNIYSQSEGMIYLKNGSRIKGEIKENISENNYSVTLSDGTVLEFSKEQIEHIDHHPNEYKYAGNGIQLLTKGTYISFDVNHMAANFSNEWGEGKRIGMGGSFSMGHQFKQAFGIGAGAGLDWHEQIMLPAFVEINGLISHRIFNIIRKNGNGYQIPFSYRLQAGHNFQIEEWISDPQEFESVKGGWMIYPSFGLAFPTHNATTLRFDIGYKFQRFFRKYEYDWSPNYFQQDKITLKSFSMRIGVLF